MLVFKGRSILPGTVKGQALVSRQGFNILASLKKNVGLRSWKAVCSDQDNPDLYGKVITDTILCLPQTIGSTIGGLILERMAKKRLAPRAMLFSQKIDSLAAAGVIMADIWIRSRIVTVDKLGSKFLDAVYEGQNIEVQKDGTVTLI